MNEYDFAHLKATSCPLDHLIIPPIENEEGREVQQGFRPQDDRHSRQGAYLDHQPGRPACSHGAGKGGYCAVYVKVRGTLDIGAQPGLAEFDDKTERLAGLARSWISTAAIQPRWPRLRGRWRNLSVLRQPLPFGACPGHTGVEQDKQTIRRLPV